MNRYLSVFCAVLFTLCPLSVRAADQFSMGVGAGALYSGIGVNAALRGKDHLGYVAAGCIGVGYSHHSGWILPCGAAAGWIWTGWFDQAVQRHGLGVYAGPVGVNDHDKAYYGLGITYVYFLQGVDARGWNFGVTPAMGKEHGNNQGSLLLNVGYQF